MLRKWAQQLAYKWNLKATEGKEQTKGRGVGVMTRNPLQAIPIKATVPTQLGCHFIDARCLEAPGSRRICAFIISCMLLSRSSIASGQFTLGGIS